MLQSAFTPQHLLVRSTTALNDTLEVDLPSVKYSIDVPETVTIRIPAAALLSKNEIVASPPILLRATPGVLVLNGTLRDGNVETTLQKGPSNLVVTVIGDKWTLQLDGDSNDKSVPQHAFGLPICSMSGDQ